MITVVITLAAGLIINVDAALLVLLSLLAFQWCDQLVTEIKSIKD